MRPEFGNLEHIAISRGERQKLPKCRIYPQWSIERDESGQPTSLGLVGWACRCGNPDCETLKTRFPHRSAQ